MVLSSDSLAPDVDGDEDIPDTADGCEDIDYGWPCNHWADLNDDFRAEPVPGNNDPLVCLDTGIEETCVRFGNKPSYLFNDEIDYGTDTACEFLVGNADNYVEDPSVNDDDEKVQLRADLIDAANNCSDDELVSKDDETINVYIYNDTFGTESFGRSKKDAGNHECYAYMFIDLGHLPPNTGTYEYTSSTGEENITEHEMGHVMGLKHVCEIDGPDVTQPSSTNIMTTDSDENCCCECGVEMGHDTADTGNPWLDACADCSTADLPDTCGAGTSPEYDQCDPDCLDQLYGGDREDPFTNDKIGTYEKREGDLTGPGYGQLTQILDTAHKFCDCACEAKDQNKNAAATNMWRVGIDGELNCFAGTGDFALILTRLRDSDSDDSGWATLVPVLIDGNHIGRLSWITSAEILDFGDYAHLFAAESGYPFAFDNQDPDALDTTHLFKFDAQTTTRTWTAGTVASTNRWVADDIDTTASEIAWPIVRLQTQCNNDYAAEDVRSLRFPPNAYRLPIKHFDPLITWKQEVLLRPDFDQELMVVELRGAPGVSRAFPLQAIPNTNKWGWSIDWLGLSMNGWIKEVGTPLGSKLQFHVDTGSFEGKTWDDETFPDLLKMP